MGKYIIIEGQDGTGKTTQADLLQNHLESLGHKTIHIKEPGGSPIAEEIRNVILNGTLKRTPMTNILLFTANRHELWHNVIKPALDEGTWVVCTRNYWSSLAYQGYGEGASPEVITKITDTFTGVRYMNPDAAIMLLFDNLEARKTRIAQRGITAAPDTFEMRETAFQKKVDAAYHKIAKDFSIPTIDAAQSIEAVQAQLRKLIGL